MTIDEAVADLTKHRQFCEKVNWKTHAKAISLGIEALKRCKVLAENDYYWQVRPLPGETEE
jgi:hypothetical protein